MISAIKIVMTGTICNKSTNEDIENRQTNIHKKKKEL